MKKLFTIAIFCLVSGFGFCQENNLKEYQNCFLLYEKELTTKDFWEERSWGQCLIVFQKTECLQGRKVTLKITRKNNVFSEKQSIYTNTCNYLNSYSYLNSKFGEYHLGPEVKCWYSDSNDNFSITMIIPANENTTCFPLSYDKKEGEACYDKININEALNFEIIKVE